MITLNSEVSGRFKFEAVKRNGDRRILAEFPNLILNNGLDLIGTTAYYLNYCRVGSGSNAPQVTDSYLGNQTAYTNTTSGSTTNGTQGTSPIYRWYKVTKRFAEGVATGNISEVGMSSTDGNNTGDVLFSRALILDGSGNPTTITVLSNETLDVTYEFRRYIPETDVTGTVELRGNTHNYTGRACMWASWHMPFQGGTSPNDQMRVYDGTIGDITGAPSGSNSYTDTETIYSYSNGNYYRDWKYSLSLSQGNLTNFISAARIGMVGAYYQFGFSPDIEKTSDDIMSLTFRASWSRRT